MINKERKKFALKPRRSAGCTATTPMLGSCVLVHGNEETGYCYISFSPDFEDFVAGKLPRGLAPFDPAYIRVREVRSAWRVEAVYVVDAVSVALWETPERPSWVGKLKQEKRDDPDTQSPTSHDTAAQRA